MPLGPRINDTVKQLIAEVYLKHPDWRAKQVQHEVNIKLGSEYPGLSAVQKELQNIRKRDAERSTESKELDKPWTLSSLVEHPIPAEALPSVLQLWVLYREYDNYVRRLSPDSIFASTEASQLNMLTIREAQWVGRLYSVTNDTEVLEALTKQCAYFERLTETSGLREVISKHFSAVTLALFSIITKEEITPERMKEILYEYEEEDDRLGNAIIIASILHRQKKEAQNEGTHNQEGKE
ncbi:hypothetical protein ACFLYR_07955 [Chloroflexota bacterium]